MCVCVCVCVFTNLISTSIHGPRKKPKKPCQEQEIKYLESPPWGKRKKLWVKKKEKANLVRPLEKKSRLYIYIYININVNVNICERLR